jgi:Na+-transporting methylmalonyl-CoA/oxaloacetate decarboxylase gamma subunit
MSLMIMAFVAIALVALILIVITISVFLASRAENEGVDVDTSDEAVESVVREALRTGRPAVGDVVGGKLRIRRVDE